MDHNHFLRRASLILIIWLIAMGISLLVVPRLPGELPAWVPWAVGILLAVIGTVADLIGLFGREIPLPAGDTTLDQRSGGATFEAEATVQGDVVAHDKIVHGDEVHGNKVLGSKVLGDKIVQVQPPPEPLTPLDLPPGLPTWTGREADTQWLLDQLRQPSGVVALTGIVGMGGIGKSALAVHVAHQVDRDDFPDGVLWLDLRGAQLDVLLGSVAAYYGQRARVDEEPTLKRKAAVVRSILAGKHALLILDNADTSQQLDLLLPGEGPCVTVVTTRHRNLRALRGATTRPLDQMTLDEARTLFARILARTLSEDEATEVNHLHELLEGLPLALDLAASRLREWRRPWADYAAAVGDALRGLTVLEDPEGSRSARAAFALSYDGLERTSAGPLPRPGRPAQPHLRPRRGRCPGRHRGGDGARDPGAPGDPVPGRATAGTWRPLPPARPAGRLRPRTPAER